MVPQIQNNGGGWGKGKGEEGEHSWWETTCEEKTREGQEKEEMAMVSGVFIEKYFFVPYFSLAMVREVL